MIIKGITDEDFTNYKKPSMFIAMPHCSFKCERESGSECCQNKALAEEKSFAIQDTDIIERYIKNDITDAIVFGGLEPFDSYPDVFNLIAKLRYIYHCRDDVVIYSGYDKNELGGMLEGLKIFDNIIVKFGRYIPDRPQRYDDVLGVTLASDNQYAEAIS